MTPCPKAAVRSSGDEQQRDGMCNGRYRFISGVLSIFSQNTLIGRAMRWELGGVRVDDALEDRTCKQGGDRVADLLLLQSDGAFENEVVGKRLQPCGLSNG